MITSTFSDFIYVRNTYRKPMKLPSSKHLHNNNKHFYLFYKCEGVLTSWKMFDMIVCCCLGDNNMDDDVMDFWFFSCAAYDSTRTKWNITWRARTTGENISCLFILFRHHHDFLSWVYTNMCTNITFSQACAKAPSLLLSNNHLCIPPQHSSL